MTSGDWAAIATSVLVAVISGLIGWGRSWARSLGHRLDELEDHLQEQISAVSERVARIEGPPGPRYPPARGRR